MSIYKHYKVTYESGAVQQVAFFSKSTLDMGHLEVTSYGPDGYYKAGLSKRIAMTFDDFETMIQHAKDCHIVEQWSEKLNSLVRV